MMRKLPYATLLAAAVLVLATAQAQAQTAMPSEVLRTETQRRFEVLLLRDGLALRPRTADRSIQSIEIARGTIAIDGAPVTGSELRARLGADADVVMQLSYLDADARQRLFGSAGSAAPAAAPPLELPAPPAVPPAAATPAPPAAPDPPPLPELESRERSRRSDSRVRIFGGSITVAANEIVDGDVVAVGGSAVIRGEVRGNVVSVGGSVELGPNAIVRQDVTVVGGVLRADDTARIDGEVHEVALSRFNLDGRFWPRVPGVWGWTFGSAFALMGTLIRAGVLSILVALVILLAREQVDAVSLRAAADPLKSGGVGFLAQLLFLPLLLITIIVFVITIIGIPLLVFIPFALLALGLVALVGFSAVAQNAGRFVAARFGWSLPSPYGTALAGILVLLSPLLLARLIGLAGGLVFPMTAALSLVGWLVEYAAWTIGFGAAALAWLNRGRSSLAVQTGP
jgi:hypothetical protein